MKPITITFGTSSAGARYFDVEQDGKVCDGLAWDEMIGQVITLTLQAQPGGRAYPMKTPQEWGEERNRRLGSAERTVEVAALPEVDTVGAATERSRAQGYTGDACTTCGQFRMRQAGHCLVCDECGTTTGCS